jgi:hypothetical protein
MRTQVLQWRRYKEGKTQMPKTVLTIALFMGGIALLSPTPARSQALGGSGQRLEGTWILTGTAGPITLKSITTYLPDGAAFGANSNTFQALQGGAPQTQTFNNPAQGQWVRTGDREFSGFVINLVFDAKGQVSAVSRVRFKILLNDVADSATGTAAIETLDFNGSVVFTTKATLDLKRLSADLL